MRKMLQMIVCLMILDDSDFCMGNLDWDKTSILFNKKT